MIGAEHADYHNMYLIQNLLEWLCLRRERSKRGVLYAEFRLALAALDLYV